MQTTVFDKYLTRGEEKRLMGAIGRVDCPFARRDYHLFRLMLATGIRVGAACGLTVNDARQALATGRLTLRPEIQKRRLEHSVPLNRRAHEALRGLLSVRHAARQPNDPDAPLLFGRKGPGLSVRSVEARIKQWAREAEIDCAKDITPHWLRHTLAKRVMEQSTSANPLGIVGSVLGHRSANSTAIYVQPDKEQIAGELAALH
ncbi:recombinase XerC [Guyparkeria sp. SB14A]|uniref:tyrosine-type recombinase/integrase n=1 Tax=Guyparkeria sp. SB14A TaxID=2571147 RepID=UPI0010AD8BB4|nr:tyrosine-type recombinase/integrase [Guyparkeria sp. SB14A]TKA91789.1 recombinase XerC [Guyparkeria sp. SB14A]